MSKENFSKEFEDIYLANIKRKGSDKFLEFLKTTDFFTAPASTKYHSNFEGGLVEHSVKAYKRFLKTVESEFGKDYLKKEGVMDTIATIALLHDVCKVNCYKTEMRNVKVNGNWEQKPFFAYDDPMPYGHGEKSVYMISGFMQLSREEAMAINWHMGAYDAREGSFNYNSSKAFHMFPLAFLFHMSDMMATYLDEKIIK